jgi:hypothetical protein
MYQDFSSLLLEFMDSNDINTAPKPPKMKVIGTKATAMASTEYVAINNNTSYVNIVL